MDSLQMIKFICKKLVFLHKWIFHKHYEGLRKSFDSIKDGVMARC